MSSATRLARIASTVVKYRLDAIVDRERIATELLPSPLRVVWRMSPTRLLPTPSDPPARRLRLAIESLGPVFIKFGQIQSTRRDRLPTEIADELAKLQDNVPPFHGAEAIATVEKSLGKPVNEVFRSLDEQPLASASVAQVHAAQLLDGTDVVVKVIRPGIESVIRQDLKLLHTIARLMERVSADARRLHLIAIAEDYERTILNELNLLHEAANTSKLRRNFADSPLLYVPRVYWDFTREDVLVLERIHGVPISNVAELKARGTDMRVLAERGVETFFKQVFVDNFFHADMHPGNIFVDVVDPSSPRYIAVDCAIIGSLTEDDQTYLARNLLAFFHQDYREVARLHLESGWVPASTDVTEIETVIRQVCEPIFEKPLKDISFGHFLISLFQTARAFDMEVQPQLVLLQKTLLNIEGLGRQLYPDLDLWQTAKPFMEGWMRERLSPLTMLRQLSVQAPDLIDQLPRLPELLVRATRGLQRIDRLAAEQQASINRLTEVLESRNRRGAAARVTGVLLLLGATALFAFALPSASAAYDTTPLLAGFIAALIGTLLLARG